MGRRKVKVHGDGRTWFHWVVFQRTRDGGWRVIDPDPGRPGTQQLTGNEREEYKAVTYLPVAARLPGGRALLN
jgi:hypothetical protein